MRWPQPASLFQPLPLLPLLLCPGSQKSHSLSHLHTLARALLLPPVRVNSNVISIGSLLLLVFLSSHHHLSAFPLDANMLRVESLSFLSVSPVPCMVPEASDMESEFSYTPWDLLHILSPSCPSFLSLDVTLCLSEPNRYAHRSGRVEAAILTPSAQYFLISTPLMWNMSNLGR